MLPSEVGGLVLRDIVKTTRTFYPLCNQPTGGKPSNCIPSELRATCNCYTNRKAVSTATSHRMTVTAGTSSGTSFNGSAFLKVFFSVVCTSASDTNISEDQGRSGFLIAVVKPWSAAQPIQRAATLRMHRIPGYFEIQKQFMDFFECGTEDP